MEYFICISCNIYFLISKSTKLKTIKKKKISLHLNRLQNYNNIVKIMNICEYARNLAKVCNFEKSMIDNKIKLRIIYKMLMKIILMTIIVLWIKECIDNDENVFSFWNIYNFWKLKTFYYLICNFIQFKTLETLIKK